MIKRIVTPCAGSADMTERYYFGDKEVTKSEFDASFPAFDFEAAGSVRGPAMSGYPFASDALAEHPDNVQAAYELSVKAGIPTQFDGDGRPILTSRAHKRDYCKLQNVFDRDGGYGDAQRHSYRGEY